MLLRAKAHEVTFFLIFAIGPLTLLPLSVFKCFFILVDLHLQRDTQGVCQEWRDDCWGKWDWEMLLDENVFGRGCCWLFFNLQVFWRMHRKGFFIFFIFFFHNGVRESLRSYTIYDSFLLSFQKNIELFCVLYFSCSYIFVGLESFSFDWWKLNQSVCGHACKWPPKKEGIDNVIYLLFIFLFCSYNRMITSNMIFCECFQIVIVTLTPIEKLCLLFSNNSFTKSEI